MTVRELVTTWGFEIDTKQLTEMEKTIKQVKHVVAALFAVETVKKFADIVISTAEWGEETAKTAQKIGMNTQNLQALQYAAKMADVDTGELTVGMKFLNTALYDASRGSSEAQRKFNALGMSYKDANGKMLNTEQALGQIADKFKGMEDGPKKTALAVDLFGRSGINMIPMLNQGSKHLAEITQEAINFGLVMDESAIKQSEEFMDSMKRVQGAMSGLRNEIGISLMPVFSDLLKKFIEWFRLNRQAIGTNLKLFFSEIVKYATYLGKAFGFIIEAGKKIIESTGGFERWTRIMAAGLTAVGAAALWMQIKFLAIPLAIGAAVAAIYILLDDIVGFFNGKDSLLGRALGEIQKRFPEAFKFVYDVFSNLASQFDVLVNVFKTIWGWLSRLNSAVKDFLSPMVSLLDRAIEGWTRLFRLVPGLMGKYMTRVSAEIQGNPLMGTEAISNVGNLIRNSAPQPTSYRNTLANYTPGGRIEFKPSVSITLNGGMTNDQTGGIVADVVNKIFGDLIQESSMDFAPSIAR